MEKIINIGTIKTSPRTGEFNIELYLVTVTVFNDTLNITGSGKVVRALFFNLKTVLIH